jgi:hypothetical protein
MAPSDLQDDLTAEQREYALAKAYTEARQGPLRRRPNWRKARILLLLILTPLAYAAIMPLVSRDLAAGWFQAWVAATSGLSGLLLAMLAGLTAGSQAIYGGDPQALADFLNFASIDILCILATGFVLFGFGSKLRLVPKLGSPQLGFLENMAKGFPVGRGIKARRIGGTSGGLAFALLQVALIFAALYFFVFHPAMADGQMFRDAHYHCARSSGSGRYSHCIQYAANTLEQTVWKLGWMSSLMAALAPFGLWYGLMCLTYPVWLAAGRPRQG